MKLAGWMGAVATLLGCGSALGAQAQEIEVKHYQPVLDVTKDPGCGRKLATKAERVAHNRMLAENYFVGYQISQVLGLNYDYGAWGCYAPNANVLLGAADPTGTGVVIPPMPRSTELTGEQRGYYNTFNDWGPVFGTLVVIPFEEGAYSRMMWAGTSKKDGKRYELWELVLIQVNDHGLITNFEFWDDSINLDKTTKMIFGKSILGLGTEKYGEAIQAYPKEKK